MFQNFFQVVSGNRKQKERAATSFFRPFLFLVLIIKSSLF